MRAIFISYRREDSEGQAGRLFDDLVTHFGDDSVFMDVAGIEAGRDFRRAIDQHVASCGVLLAVIGKKWLDAKDESGRRRLDNPMDFVRLETASALKRDIPVIPVLVAGASMPRADDLPEDLKELVYRNGVELRHTRWDSDVEVLVKALSPYVQVKGEMTSPPSPTEPGVPRSLRTRSTWIVIPVLVSLLVLAFGVVGYLWYRKSPEGTTSGLPTPSPTASGEKAVANPSAASIESPAATQAENTPAERALSFEDWQGKWELWIEEKGLSIGPFEMDLKSNQSGVEGNVKAVIDGNVQQVSFSGTFVTSDFSEVTAEYTDETDDSCPEARIVFKLEKDGRSMNGFWGPCGEELPTHWKAKKR